MIHVVEPDQYDIVQPIFKGLADTLIVTAVIEGKCPGEIYVDDPVTPEIALIVSGEGYFLAGNETNDQFNTQLRDFLNEKIIPEKLKKGEENISLNYFPDTWEEKISVILENKFPVRIHGYTYRLKNRDQLRITDWKERIPPGFQLVRVDESLLESDLKNIEDVTASVKTTWNSLEDFLRYGFGFFLLHDNTIVSWCLTDCVSGTKCEIGIETDETYRRQGCAAITAAAMVEYCLSQGMTDIGWHTGVTNTGSIKTAEKVGFKRTLKDTYYFCWFYPVDNFIEHGYISWLASEFAESAEWFERAIAVAESGDYNSIQLTKYHSLPALCFYAACSWASAGENEKSLKNLRKIIKMGPDDPGRFLEVLKTSESLKVLHKEKEWNSLLETLEEMKRLK